jgi:hypothetical protein
VGGDWPEASVNGTVVASGNGVEEIREFAMDVGITSSTKERTLHLVTGLIVVGVGYSAVLLAIRMLFMG